MERHLLEGGACLRLVAYQRRCDQYIFNVLPYSLSPSTTCANQNSNRRKHQLIFQDKICQYVYKYVQFALYNMSTYQLMDMSKHHLNNPGVSALISTSCNTPSLLLNETSTSFKKYVYLHHLICQQVSQLMSNVHMHEKIQQTPADISTRQQNNASVYITKYISQLINT